MYTYVLYKYMLSTREINELEDKQYRLVSIYLTVYSILLNQNLKHNLPIARTTINVHHFILKCVLCGQQLINTASLRNVHKQIKISKSLVTTHCALSQSTRVRMLKYTCKTAQITDSRDFFLRRSNSGVSVLF